ncbi:MAG: P-II family nitrogen regulator [Clostridia bacterium]|nr:P-II family nitrogen regulator [Clostridia bacterium]
MKGLKFLLLVSERSRANDYYAILRDVGIRHVVGTSCYGAFENSIIDFVGLNSETRVMFLAAVRESDEQRLVSELTFKTPLITAKSEFAAILPTGGFAESAVKYFVGSDEVKGDDNMKSTDIKRTLILSVVNKGYKNDVMEAARKAGATGGTIVKAGGTGADVAKVLGITISEEKEIVLIVSDMKKRNDIMHAIMDKAGSKTAAQGVIFSLPVDKVLGISALEDIELKI